MPYGRAEKARRARIAARPPVCGNRGCPRYCAPEAAKCSMHLEAERKAQEAAEARYKKILGLCLAVRCAVCGAIH